MAIRVPFTKIAGLPARAQYELQRNFEDIEKAYENGDMTKVPFPMISGLPYKAQQELRRNFQELEAGCECGPVPPNTVAPGTVVTSDNWTGRTAGSDADGTSQDLYLGGAVFPWDIIEGTWTCNSYSGGTIRTADGAGSPNSQLVRIVCVVDQADVRVDTVWNPFNTGTAGSLIGMIARWEDANNYVFAYCEQAPAGTYKVTYGKVKNGTTTLYGTSPISNNVSNSLFSLEVNGAYIGVKVSGSYLETPVLDSDVPAGYGVGLMSKRNTTSNDTFVVTAV